MPRFLQAFMAAAKLPGLALLLFFATLVQASEWTAAYPQVRAIFPEADAYGDVEGTPPSAAVYKAGQVIGYAFLTFDALRIPAYSGKPINTLVGIDKTGRIVGLTIVNHDEPILAVGISQERLGHFVDQYKEKSAFDKIVIGARREGHVAIDGISGATITVMVQNATVMRAAKAVAESRGIRRSGLAGTGAVVEKPEVAAPTESRPVEERALAFATPPANKPEVEERRESPAGVVAASARKPPAMEHPGAIPQSQPLVHGVVPLSPEMPPNHIAPLPANPGTWIPPEEEPAWIAIWKSRGFDIAVLAGGLLLLFLVLIFQDWLARDPTLLTYVRNGFHVYTLFFIGWWGLAQLSVVNVLTFITAVMNGFRWESFLIDPMLFILWSFVAVTLLLWGRGIYCGWLCPFGALQELVLIVARRFRVPEVEFSDAVHERLVALKYIILILIFGVSLQSLSEAAWYAEVEPFKTTIAMRFQREWQYVVYALVLIGLAAVNRKFYCKYLCPLGAALTIPGRFRLFDWWLRRRKECGKPCQMCARRCPVGAIRPTGEINANECHYCLDCQVIYYNENVCLPLVERHKRREAQAQRIKVDRQSVEWGPGDQV